MKTQDLTEQEVIEASRSQPRPFDYLCEKYPRKIVEARVESMVRKGIADYGVSVETFWVKPTD